MANRCPRSVRACAPVEQGRLVGNRKLVEIASRTGATPAQAALARTMRHAGLIAIPKAGSAAHVQENRAAADLVLSADDLALLDATFPPLRGRCPLEML